MKEFRNSTAPLCICYNAINNAYIYIKILTTILQIPKLNKITDALYVQFINCRLVGI